MGADEETTRPLRVALMEADLSSSQQSLLRKHCPSDVEAQKKELTELLLTYQGHLSLLYKTNTEDKTDGTCTSLLPHLLASVPILGGTTRLTRYEHPFRRTGDLCALHTRLPDTRFASADDEHVGMTSKELVALLEQLDVLDTHAGFAKPQVEGLFKRANAERLADYEANGAARVKEAAVKAREEAVAAARYAATGSFSSDVGQRAARAKATQLDVLAVEAEEYAKSVESGREKVKGLPQTLKVDEFVYVLVKVAVGRFRNVLDVHEAFLWFIKAHLLEHESSRLVDDYMLSDLREPEVVKLLDAQRTELRQVHDQYGERFGGGGEHQRPRCSSRPQYSPQSSLRSLFLLHYRGRVLIAADGVHIARALLHFKRRFRSLLCRRSQSR